MHPFLNLLCSVILWVSVIKDEKNGNLKGPASSFQAWMISGVQILNPFLQISSYFMLFIDFFSCGYE